MRMSTITSKSCGLVLRQILKKKFKNTEGNTRQEKEKNSGFALNQGYVLDSFGENTYSLDKGR